MTVDASESGSDLATPFRRFTTDPFCASRWPLTALFANEIATSPALLDVVASVPPEKRQVTNFMSAMHYRVLQRPQEPISRYCYAISGDATRPVEAAAGSSFLDFVERHRSEITATMRSVDVQTNEPARCLVLWPGIQVVGHRVGSSLVNLIDVGSGPGLTMIPHRYRYDFAGAKTGAHRSPVELRANLTGNLAPSIASNGLRVNAVGIDLQARSLNNPEQRLRSLACVFPEDKSRVDRLRAATPLVTGRNRPVIVSGDANEVLLDTIGSHVGVGPVCVMTSFMQMYYSGSQRDQFIKELMKAAEGRAAVGERGEIWWLNHDWPENLTPEARDAVQLALGERAPLNGGRYAPVVLSRVDPSGVVENTPLAVAEAYTNVIEWLNRDYGREIDPSPEFAGDRGELQTGELGTPLL